MATKSFRFSTLGYLALEGVGALHASYTLLLNVTESDINEGKKLFLSASMLCNAARAYGSGVIKPWCTVENNIDNKKYVLNTGYTGSIAPIPKKATHYISLNRFKQV